MNWSLPPSRVPELMDDPAIDAAEHLHALDALATINAVSRTAAQLAAAIRRLGGSSRPGGRFVVADIACGGGDLTCDLATRLVRLGNQPGAAEDSPLLVGVDVSPRAIDRARRLAAGRGVDASFMIRDVLSEGLPPCDVAVCSLFVHHLDDQDAVRLVRRMAESARRGFVISDLIRSRLGLALAVLGTGLLSRSRVARIDGPLSVRAARTPAEYRELCAAAGVGGAAINRSWPERIVIEWRRPGASPAGERP
jgi:SAM-dependent methyltransferase